MLLYQEKTPPDISCAFALSDFDASFAVQHSTSLWFSSFFMAGPSHSCCSGRIGLFLYSVLSSLLCSTIRSMIHSSSMCLSSLHGVVRRRRRYWIPWCPWAHPTTIHPGLPAMFIFEWEWVVRVTVALSSFFGVLCEARANPAVFDTVCAMAACMPITTTRE